MLDQSLVNSSSISLTEFENELKEEFTNFYRYIDECNKFNESVQKNFNAFKKNLDKSQSGESVVKRKIDEEANQSKKREKESLNLLCQIKASYDRNLNKLREHHQKQISNVLDKHKLEIQKWKSKYDKLKFDKKVDKVEVDDAVHNSKFLQTKLDKVTAELASLQSQFESAEQELVKIRSEKRTAVEEVKELQKENSKLKSDITSKDKETAQLKSKIKDTEAKLKSKDEAIKNKDDLIKSKEDLVKNKENALKEKSTKLKAKEKELDELKVRYEALCNDHSKLNSESKVVVPKDDSSLSCAAGSVDGNHKEELMMTKVELRTATRDLNRKIDLCNFLRRELNEAKEKIAKYEATLDQEKKSCDDHLAQIERYRNEISSKKMAIDNKEDEIMKLKYLMDENTKNMDLKVKVNRFSFYNISIPHVDLSFENL